ncbi:Thioredoxin [Manis javanica]|nr:Thioredoxin [Manis javanica]
MKQMERKYAFLDVLNSAGDKLTVVDFPATWYGPCKQIKPLFISSLKSTAAPCALKLKWIWMAVRMLLQSGKSNACQPFSFLKR